MIRVNDLSRKSFLFSLLLCWLLVAGCRDPFVPEIEGFESLLVVEGRLTTDTTGSTILLSNSYGFGGDTLIPVSDANVKIIDETGIEYLLAEKVPGQYCSDPALFLPEAGQSYQLQIRTSAGRSYVSDWQLLKATPGIDRLEPELFTQANVNGEQLEGARFLLDAQSVNEEASYFLWTYRETWEFFTPYLKRAEWIWDPEPRVQRLPYDEEVNHCWRQAASTEIILGTTRDISGNKVADFPIHTVNVKSDKVNWGYVLQVQQYSISEEEYSFLNTIRQNTETTGSIFDPVPGEIVGNIRCVDDPSQPVIGYFSASEVSEAMAYINRDFFPDSVRTTDALNYCDLDTIFFNSGSREAVLATLRSRTEQGGFTYLDTAFQVLTPVGFKLAPKECADCKLTGTPVKPSFWPN